MVIKITLECPHCHNLVKLQIIDPAGVGLLDKHENPPIKITSAKVEIYDNEDPQLLGQDFTISI